MNRKTEASLYLLLLSFLALFGVFIQNTYYLYLGSVIGIYAILALGLNLLFGFTGQISLGHAGFFALGAYVSGLLDIYFGLHPIVSSLVAVVCTGVIGYGMGFIILRMAGHYLAVATLAFGMIIYIVALNWNDVTGGVNGINVAGISIFAYTFSVRDYYFVVVSVVVIAFYICKKVTQCRVGLALKAVREDEIAAQTSGINIVKYKVFAFVLSVCFAALAGTIFGYMNKNISPGLFDLHCSITILVIVIVGGLGSNVGPLIGAPFVKLIPEVFAKYAQFHLFTYGFVLVLVLVAAPKGLAGLFPKWASRSTVDLPLKTHSNSEK